MAVLRQRLCALGCLLCGLMAFEARSQELAAPEYQVKATFLYSFAELCDWPTNAFAAADSPIVIGVLGQDPFGRFLDDTVKGKQIGARKIVVQRFRHLDEIKSCQMLFVSSSEKSRVDNILKALARRPILTVGDLDGFAERGGMIRLITERGQIRFAINTTAAEQAGLELSSTLLRLATIVRRQEAAP